MVQSSSRGFAGGGAVKKPALGNDVTDFDLVLVGGPHTGALLKYL